MDLKICVNCNTGYTDQDAKHFGHCPHCGSASFTLATEQEPPTTAARINTMDISGFAEVEKFIVAHKEATRSLVAAQNKTTHAVRSLAITFVAAPVIAIATFFVVALSIISESTTFIVFTAVTAIVISIYVLVLALIELARSRVY